MTYYNTTHLEGEALFCEQVKAKSLQAKVYEVFKSNPQPMAWSEVKQRLGDVNESSLKRSITNLKNALKLEKTKEKVISIYGAPAYRYKLI